MHRIVAIFLFVAFLTMASGVPQRVHQQQHECQDCRAALAQWILHHRPGETPKPQPHGACQICVLLHAPMVGGVPAVVLVDAGAVPAQGIRIEIRQAGAFPVFGLSCRGPPVS